MYPGLRPSPSCPRLVPINPGSPPGRQSPQCCGGPRGLSAAGLRQVPPSPPAGGMFRLQLLHIRPPRQRSGPAEPPPQPLPLGTNPPQFDWDGCLVQLELLLPFGLWPLSRVSLWIPSAPPFWRIRWQRPLLPPDQSHPQRGGSGVWALFLKRSTLLLPRSPRQLPSSA